MRHWLYYREMSEKKRARSPRAQPYWSVAHALCGLSALVLLLCISSSQAQTVSSATSASRSSAPQKKKCCFCISPNKGVENAAEFMEYCSTCLMNPKLNSKVASCDIRESLAAKDFTGPDPEKCSPDVLVYNLEHGPIPGKVFGRIDVCRKSMPSCALEFVDLSCRTFEDPNDVAKYLKDLQRSLGKGATVTLCGNATSNYPKDKCASFESARVTYVVSSEKIDSPPSRCAKSFTTCDREGFTHTCLNGRNELKEQVCCAKMVRSPDGRTEYGSSNGLWGEAGEGCSAFPSCPENCSTKKYCSQGGDKLFIRECVKIRGGDYACQLDWDNCVAFGRVCDAKNLMCDDPPKAPSSSAGASSRSSAKSGLSGPQSSRDGAQGDFVEVSRANQEYQMSPSWLLTATSLKNLFGSSIVIEVAGSLADAGILLHTIDVGSTLGVLRFESGDIIHFVNDTPIRTRGDLVKNLSPALPYLGITYTRGGVRKLVTLRVRTGVESASK